MSKLEFQSINTKLQAYRLVHDPTQLFCLLFLKYGLSTEDFFISFINQILFNECSYYSFIYAEQIYNCDLVEYLKQFFNLDSSKKLMAKINKNNQNYFKFFSKPIFSDFYFNKLLGKYYDQKAEFFYFNNYSGKKNTQLLRENELKNAINYDISSFDNDTQNEIIFNNRMRKIIDNNLDSKNVSITLSVITKRDFNESNKIITSQSFKANVDDIIIDIEEKKITSNELLNKCNLDESKKINNKIENSELKEKYKLITNRELSILVENRNINNNKNKNINQNLKNVGIVVNPINQKDHFKSFDNNIKEKNDYKQIKLKENLIEINTPRIINNKLFDINNVKKFSPLYKKPKLKIKYKFESTKKSLTQKKMSTLNINTLKNSQNSIKYNIFSPQKNNVKYLFNNLKSSIRKKSEIQESNKDNSDLGNINIYGKSELPSINLEKSLKRLGKKNGILYRNKHPKNSNLNIYSFKNTNFKLLKKNQISLNKINTQRIINKLSLEVKGVNPRKNISVFSDDKISDRNINIININIEKKNFKYIKNNFLKKLRPSYSMNKEIESFNNDIKTLELTNKANKSNNNTSRNKLKKCIKLTSKFIFDEIKKKDINFKHKKIIHPINLLKTNNLISKIN